MELSMGSESPVASANNSGEEQEVSHNSVSVRKGKNAYHRHTTRQIQQLESFFKECPHPDENQRRQLSNELGMESKQIKFWFQNKRTQTKAQSERADNSVLRADNERIQCENLAIREALKNVICPACGGPPFGEEERQHSLQKLQLENAQLKEEHEKVAALLAKYIGKPISQINSLIPPVITSGSFPSEYPTGRYATPNLDLELNPAISDPIPFPYQLKAISDMEKALMAELASNAIDELIKLLRVNEPLWTATEPDRSYVINRENYHKIFPKNNHFKTPNARFESSKDSATITISGLNLVEMFLDPNKWVDLFPTIITKASIIQVVETGVIENRSGWLQLMYEQMHILSPLVPPREFCFLRHCQQIEPETWVVVDISYDFLKDYVSPSRAWRLPSGCMIQAMPNGCSKVTWVEHVEVDDRTQTHRLYRDLICGGSAYGAQRWIVTLQRMSERLTFTYGQIAPAHDLGGVISTSEGRRSMMKLSHRMVKNFSAMLSMSGKLDFPQLSEVNNSGVRVSVRRSGEIGQPNGVIVSAATSLWLPLPPQTVFDFFRDEKNRTQWDILSNGHSVQEIAHISNGTHSGNCISIIQPFNPNETCMVVLQESSTDALGSIVVYAPIDIPTMNMAINTEDTMMVPILPSGFVISGDGRPATQTNGVGSSSSNIARSIGGGGGSLITVAFQILVSPPSSTSVASSSTAQELNMESVATVNTLISSTVQKIKAALNCATMD